MINAQTLKSFLSSPKKIVITTHHKPDGDALGSSLGLYLWLKKGGHEVEVVSPTDYPDFLLWLPHEKEVINFEQRPNHCIKLIEEAELFFCLDFNRLNRANAAGSLIGQSKGTKVMIDHHPEPDHFADYEFWNTKACSTAQLVYQFILQMDGKEMMDMDIAICLYTGILTDTNTFRTNNTSSEAHRIAADLMDYGIDHHQIYAEIYEAYTENRLRLLGLSITDRMHIFPELEAGIICLSGEDLRRFNIQTGDTEGIVNFPLKIKDVQLSVLIVQRPEQVKLSMRSKGNLDVNELCKKYFEGGGHKNAAGGKSNDGVEETKNILISILARERENIQS